jgi:hypothetical protein
MISIIDAPHNHVACRRDSRPEGDRPGDAAGPERM